MIRKWATIISWQKGVALLQNDRKSSCSNCDAHFNCSVSMLNQITPKTEHLLRVRMEQSIEPGRRVEVGITESNLLYSAMLVYLTPLVGIILSGSLMQFWLDTDAFSALGALLGGIVSFMIARNLANHLIKQPAYQPIVLYIDIPTNIIDIQTGKTPRT